MCRKSLKCIQRIIKIFVKSSCFIFIILAYETTLAEGIHFEKKIFYATFGTVSFVEVLFLSKMPAYPVNDNRQFSSALIVQLKILQRCNV